METFTVLIEQDEDGIYAAKVPDIPGCYIKKKPLNKFLKELKKLFKFV